MALETTALLQLKATLTKSLSPSLTPTVALAHQKEFAWASGTGANQGDKMYASVRSIAATAHDDVDLSAVLADALGDTLNFLRIKALIIDPSSANPGALTVNNSVGNAFVSPFGGVGHTVNARAGGLVALIAPDATAFAVSSGSADILRISNGAGSPASYTLLLIGASA